MWDFLNYRTGNWKDMVREENIRAIDATIHIIKKKEN